MQSYELDSLYVARVKVANGHALSEAVAMWKLQCKIMIYLVGKIHTGSMVD